jgi:hypothetical protein
MNETVAVQIGQMFFTTLVVLFLWYLRSFLWRDYHLDAFRQDLLEIQDRLGKYTRLNEMKPDDPVLQAFRTDINSLIKHRYHVSFVTLLVIRLTPGTRQELQSEIGFSRQIDRLGVPRRAELTALYNEILLACARQIGSTSLLAGFYLRASVIWNHIKANGLRFQKMSLDSVKELSPAVLRDVQAVERRALEIEIAESRRLSTPITA